VFSFLRNFHNGLYSRENFLTFLSPMLRWRDIARTSLGCGMGEVYLVGDGRLDQKLAVKLPTDF
jgi:hypothetical protein